MKLSLNAVFLVLFLAITGCASSQPQAYVPSKAEADSADYGLFPDGYEALIKSHMQGVLKDPESARYRFTQQPKRDFKTGATSASAIYFYSVDVLVNAKNSYGAYVGEHEYWFKIRDNKVIDYADRTQARIDLEKFLNKR